MDKINKKPIDPDIEREIESLASGLGNTLRQANRLETPDAAYFDSIYENVRHTLGNTPLDRMTTLRKTGLYQFRRLVAAAAILIMVVAGSMLLFSDKKQPVLEFGSISEEALFDYVADTDILSPVQLIVSPEGLPTIFESVEDEAIQEYLDEMDFYPVETYF